MQHHSRIITTCCSMMQDIRHIWWLSVGVRACWLPGLFDGLRQQVEAVTVFNL
ncbi:hypothetical protein ACLB1Q_35780 [Escherichia coli]